MFNANGGTVDTENKLIMWNSQIGELPVPTRNDCTFIGWYKTDGTQITEDTVFTELEDITVKAYWISGWVTADSLPENASIDAEKWTYTLREYTEQSTEFRIRVGLNMILSAHRGEQRKDRYTQIRATVTEMFGANNMLLQRQRTIHFTIDTDGATIPVRAKTAMCGAVILSSAAEKDTRLI